MAGKEKEPQQPIDENTVIDNDLEQQQEEAMAFNAEDASAAALTTEEDVQAAEAEPVAQKIAELNEQLLRAQAEMQNVRRRAESEVEKARKFALERFAKEILPIADNLERTLQVAVGNSEELKPLVEGVELTLKSFYDCMDKFNLQAINPLGEPFDPQKHEAISMVAAPHVESNSIIDVVQKGYSLNGRVIRAAMVVVAQG